MDDVYGDLENYNDVNAFVELKGENSDLKTKLEDYKVKYAILQQDYDKLAATYKKLEMNFSSLLKTARAEVARKAQIITTLNSEKDTMILNAIQNSDKSIHSLRRNVRDKSSNRKSRHDEMDPRLMKIVEKPESKRYDPGLGLDNRERIREKRLPSTDTVSSGNTEDTNALENKLRKLASYDVDASKENIVKSKRALTLKHRRKSMPIASKQCAKFSSDEDDDNCLEEKHTREWPPREDKSSKSFDRHNLSHKVSETSGIDEKYSSYHESSRETYYKKKSQKYSDKYRSLRDKFESRRKRNYSPERKRRGAREYPEDTYQKPELPRQRVLKSPSIERYDPQQRFRERRSVKERDSSQTERLKPQTVQPQPVQPQPVQPQPVQPQPVQPQPVQPQPVQPQPVQPQPVQPQPVQPQPVQPQPVQPQPVQPQPVQPQPVQPQPVQPQPVQPQPVQPQPVQPQPVQPQPVLPQPVQPQPKLGKHKLTNDNDEPTNKRARTSSNSQPTQEYTTGRPKDKVAIEEKLAPEFGSHLNNTSCQSPDYSHSDVVSTQPKEIMSTATAKLEDPRHQSKRYVKKKHGDVLVYSSVSGRDKDLKLIDTSTWDIKRIELPEALKNPPDYTAGSTQDLYNFDNPMLNISEESGEIRSDSNDMNMTDFVTESFFQDYENERINQENEKIQQRNAKNNQDNAKVNRYIPEEPKQVFSIGQRDNHIPKEAERRLPPVRYKLTKPVLAEPQSKNPLGLLLEQMKDKCGVSTAKAHDTKLDVDQTFGESPLKNSAKDKMEEMQLEGQVRDRRKTTAREIVAQDLELSDDTYDNVVVKKNNNKEKIETENHERIHEKEIPIRKKSRKVKTEAEKRTEIPQPTQSAMIVTDSKSNKKTKNKSSKQKSLSPKVTKQQEAETSEKATSANPEVEKINKKVTDNPDVENSRNKTSNQPNIKKIQTKSTSKLVDNKTNDQLEVQNVEKKIIDKAHKRKVEKTNDPLNVKMVAKKASDEQETAKIQKKTSEKPKLYKSSKSISVELEVEKVSMKTSEVLEEEKVLSSTSNITNVPEMEKLQERYSEKPEEKARKETGDVPELEKVRKQNSDRTEVKNVQEQTCDGDRSEKKTIKSKDTKAHDKKAKFSELFGDSCSLITPEDLGVPIAPTESAKIYVPIFEDAQDSVDVSEKMLRETRPAPTTISSPEGGQYKLNKEELEPDIPPVSSTVIKGKADNVMVSIPIKITPNMDISKLITKEPISTVIISTGTQPGIDSGASTKLSTAKPQQLNIPEGPLALATSTPFKRLLEAEVESCNSSERDSKRDDTSSVNHSYDSNTDPQSEDIPDVRIFIRRRRRMKKSNVK